MWDYKLNSTILPSQVKFLKIHNETEGKIFCSFESQCIVAYIISYIENHINKTGRQKEGWEEEGKNTGFKGIKNNKITFTVFITDACFYKYSRNQIAFRVMVWTGFVLLALCILTNAYRVKRVPIPMS